MIIVENFLGLPCSGWEPGTRNSGPRSEPKPEVCSHPWSTTNVSNHLLYELKYLPKELPAFLCVCFWAGETESNSRPGHLSNACIQPRSRTEQTSRSCERHQARWGLSQAPPSPAGPVALGWGGLHLVWSWSVCCAPGPPYCSLQTHSWACSAGHSGRDRDKN